MVMQLELRWMDNGCEDGLSLKNGYPRWWMPASWGAVRGGAWPVRVNRVSTLRVCRFD